MEANQNLVSPAAAGGNFACPQAQPITAPTNFVVNHICHPQEQPIIHPTEIINQHHCVPVPKHYCTFSTKDVFVRSHRKGAKSSKVSSRSRSRKRK